MMLRTGSLRIDAVGVALDGERVGAIEKRHQPGNLAESRITRLVPRVSHHYDGRWRPRLERGHELGPQRLDARVPGVVEEMEVVDEARGLAYAETQQDVDGAFRHVHDLRRVAGG